MDVTENFIWTADPHVSWGQYTVYQVDRSVYVYDMETQTSKNCLPMNRAGIFIIT